MVGGVRYIRYLTPQAVAPLACGQRRPRPVPCFTRVSRSADLYCNANCIQPPPQRPLRSSVSCPPPAALGCSLTCHVGLGSRQAHASAAATSSRMACTKRNSYMYTGPAGKRERGRDGLPESGIQSLRIWKKFSEMQAQETSLSRPRPCWYLPTVRNRAHAGNILLPMDITEIHCKFFYAGARSGRNYHATYRLP